MKKKKKKSKRFRFGKFLKVYTLSLVILVAIFLIYVSSSLEDYEENQIENYIPSAIEEIKNSAKKGNANKYIKTEDIKVNEFEKEKAKIDKGLYNLLENNEITFKKNLEKENTYNIYIGDDEIFELELDEGKKVTKLGLLSYSKRKIKQVNSKFENGIYSPSITVPSDYKVSINGHELTEENITNQESDKGLAQISKYTDIPNEVTYELTGFIEKPEIVIKDKDGKIVECKEDGDVITTKLEYEKVETKEELANKVNNPPDIMKIAEQWSLFLTNDLSGKLHGFYNISSYLIKDSELYKYAYGWATGVDITFTSAHSLNKETFTDESLSNFVIYNENAFSCEVYLQKNFTLKNGKKIEDKMHDRMYFVNVGKDGNAEWKLVNMKAITEEK